MAKEASKEPGARSNGDGDGEDVRHAASSLRWTREMVLFDAPVSLIPELLMRRIA